MFAPVEGRPTILRLQTHFHQSHVVFFFETNQRQNRTENSCGFHADQDCSMHPMCDHCTRSIDNQLIKGMLIDLTDECRGSNGEHKGMRRHALSWSMLETRTRLDNRRFP